MDERLAMWLAMRLALRRSAAWLFAAMLAGALSGCGSEPVNGEPTGGSETTPDTDTETPTPTPTPACVCEEKEDCRACYEHIGDCCYGDTTMFGMVAPLTANCERDGACSSCCNECVKKSCEEIIAGKDCPVDPASGG